MLQLALSFVLVMSSIIIWLNTHETDPLTESRITKLPPDTVKIEKCFLFKTFCCTHIYCGSRSFFIETDRHMRIKTFLGFNTDSQNISKRIKVQELASSGCQTKHQAFIIIFNDMLEQR